MPELPDYRTLQQACWNDCWFLSALVGLAYKRPHALRDLVEDAGDGSYRVTFPGHPARDVGPDDAGGGTASGPWAWGRVLEAAAAGVTNLTDARVLTYGYGIGLLTGRSRTGYTNLTGLGFAPVYRPWSRAEWFRDFLNDYAADRLMVLGGTDGRFTTPAYPWIAPQHCYALLGYDRAADRVRVRDPRGVDENVPGVPLPADRKASDYGPGEFWLTAAETEDSFCGLSVEDG